MSPVRYELGFYVPEYSVLHSHCRENLTSYILKIEFRILYNQEVHYLFRTLDITILELGFHGRVTCIRAQ
jgi:hypothetical protein